MRKFTTNSKSIRKRVPLAVKVMKGPTRSNHRGGGKKAILVVNGWHTSIINSLIPRHSLRL